jgi:drug/metabolite transporter (DMT)-like permease
MLAAMASFVINDAFVKVVGSALPVGEIMVLRGFAATLFVLLLAWRFGALRPVQAVVCLPVGLRVIGEIGATVFYLFGLMQMPFADANAILQFTPLAVTAASAILLGERVGWRRWLAASAGLVGVLLIIKPGTSAFNAASLLLLASVLCVALRDLATRQVPAALPSLMITVVSASSVLCAGLLLSAFEAWRMPELPHLAMLACAAVFLVLGYFFVTVSLRAGEISAIAPFRYSVVVFAIIVGAIVWGHVPDLLSFVGVAIVMAAGLYTFHRERRRLAGA